MESGVCDFFEFCDHMSHSIAVNQEFSDVLHCVSELNVFFRTRRPFSQRPTARLRIDVLAT